MTHAHDHGDLDQPVPDAATTSLRLQVAVEQLTRPEQHRLDRDTTAVHHQLAAAALDYLRHIRMLTTKLADAVDRGNLDGAARDRCAITIVARRHRQRRRALAATAAALPSLLDQLQSAIANSSNTGAGGNSGPAAHRSPIGLAALALVGTIQHHLGNRDRSTLTAHLRRWAAGDRHLADADAAEQWVEQARSILAPNPSKTRGLAGRCPACGNGHVTVPDDTGDPVRKRALQVDETTAVHCLACGDHTPPWRARILAAALDQQRADDAAERAQQDAPGRPR